MSSRTPAIVGFLIAGSLLLLIGYFASQRGPGTRRLDAVPRISITAPASGDIVDNPVTVSFQTTAPLRLTRDGWIADELHLHVMVDSTEIMPAAADITAADSSYRWRLPPLEPGNRRIYLTWAGRHHGNLTGATDTITVQIRR